MLKLMSKERKEKYKYLKAVRKERDYQIGLLQYANRPYSFRPVSPPNIKKKVMTTNRFMMKNAGHPPVKTFAKI